MTNLSIKLPQSRAAWGTPEFKSVLKQEIAQLDIVQLPLVEAMTSGSVPIESSVEAMVLNSFETDEAIHAKVGIFFQSIIAGCACADDPTPTDVCNEHCEAMLEINKSTAETTVTLLTT
ncbi:MAG TPA: hypothetical protein VKA23_00770 [Mariprofundaceae bacterium]|nr:hypothetical protein [Mariprofundaceae bacterium]